MSDSDTEEDEDHHNGYETMAGDYDDFDVAVSWGIYYLL